MAWVRTAASLISFGFTIYKFFQGLRETGQIKASTHLLGSRNFGFLMIIIRSRGAHHGHYSALAGYKDAKNAVPGQIPIGGRLGRRSDCAPRGCRLTGHSVKPVTRVF